MSMVPAKFDSPLTCCPWCKSAEIHTYDRDFHKRNIDRCRRCRVKFLNPQFTDSFLAQFYSQYVDPDRTALTDQVAHKIASKQEDLQVLHRFVQPGKLLAIGCGDGVELDLARRHGWEVEGYDVDVETTRRVARRTGATVHTGDFLGLKLAANSYECVYMDQVLEHPKNPGDYLHEARRILKIGGVLFVGCPNILSLACYTKTTLGRIGLKRKTRGRHYDTFHHLFYYSPRVLKDLLERQFGFDVLRVEGTPLTGARHYLRTVRWYDLPLNFLRRRIPAFESTFRIMARKTHANQTAARPSHAA